jgi:phosphoglycerol transferase MdoB-like AlkP superfamily enzyme
LQRFKTACLFFVLPLFSFLFVTINWSHVSVNSYNNELAKNGFYSLFEAYKNNQLDYDRFYLTINDSVASSKVKAIMSDSLIKYDKSDLIYQCARKGEEKKYNVMFITVESFSGEYLEYINQSDGYEMPFMNKLVKQGLFFTNLYANGTRTVRGLEALNLCIPPTPGTSIVRRPNNDNLFSSGWLFHQKGYENKFIYGGYGYFDNMNSFFSGNYFQIVDRSSYSESEIRFANVWGTCDEDSYARAIKEADKSYSSGKPFFNFLLTTSNHKPYTFPNVGIKLSNNRSGGVRYTDYALEQFFKEAPKHAWFKNTIFVIVGDHCGSSAGKSELPIMKYQIPCLIYAPELIKPQQVDKLCSQVDIVPTLAGIMNWSYESTFFGKNILTMTPNDERAFIGTYQKLGYIKGNKLMVLSPQKKYAQFSFDRFNGDMKQEKVDDAFKADAVSIYQTAEHMFVNGLNKVDRLKVRTSK